MPPAPASGDEAATEDMRLLAGTRATDKRLLGGSSADDSLRMLSALALVLTKMLAQSFLASMKKEMIRLTKIKFRYGRRVYVKCLLLVIRISNALR